MARWQQPDSAAFRIEVLLSFQRAVWDLVTPNLRAVAARSTSPLIEARFMYVLVGQEERLLVSEVGAYVAADFVPPVDICFDAVAVRSSRRCPLPIRRDGGLFHRWPDVGRQPSNNPPVAGL